MSKDKVKPIPRESGEASPIDVRRVTQAEFEKLRAELAKKRISIKDINVEKTASNKRFDAALRDVYKKIGLVSVTDTMFEEMKEIFEKYEGKIENSIILNWEIKRGSLYLEIEDTKGKNTDITFPLFPRIARLQEEKKEEVGDLKKHIETATELPKNYYKLGKHDGGKAVESAYKIVASGCATEHSIEKKPRKWYEKKVKAARLLMGLYDNLDDRKRFVGDTRSFITACYKELTLLAEQTDFSPAAMRRNFEYNNAPEGSKPEAIFGAYGAYNITLQFQRALDIYGEEKIKNSTTLLELQIGTHVGDQEGKEERFSQAMIGQGSEVPRPPKPEPELTPKPKPKPGPEGKEPPPQYKKQDSTYAPRYHERFADQRGALVMPAMDTMDEQLYVESVSQRMVKLYTTHGVSAVIDGLSQIPETRTEAVLSRVLEHLKDTDPRATMELLQKLLERSQEAVLTAMIEGLERNIATASGPAKAAWEFQRFILTLGSGPYNAQNLAEIFAQLQAIDVSDASTLDPDLKKMIELQKSYFEMYARQTMAAQLVETSLSILETSLEEAEDLKELEEQSKEEISAELKGNSDDDEDVYYGSRHVLEMLNVLIKFGYPQHIKEGYKDITNPISYYLSWIEEQAADEDSGKENTKLTETYITIDPAKSQPLFLHDINGQQFALSKMADEDGKVNLQELYRKMFANGKQEVRLFEEYQKGYEDVDNHESFANNKGGIISYFNLLGLNGDLSKVDFDKKAKTLFIEKIDGLISAKRYDEARELCLEIIGPKLDAHAAALNPNYYDNDLARARLDLIGEGWESRIQAQVKLSLAQQLHKEALSDSDDISSLGIKDPDGVVFATVGEYKQKMADMQLNRMAERKMFEEKAEFLVDKNEVDLLDLSPDFEAVIFDKLVDVSGLGAGSIADEKADIMVDLALTIGELVAISLLTAGVGGFIAGAAGAGRTIVQGGRAISSVAEVAGTGTRTFNQAARFAQWGQRAGSWVRGGRAVPLNGSWRRPVGTFVRWVMTPAQASADAGRIARLGAGLKNLGKGGLKVVGESMLFTGAQNAVRGDAPDISMHSLFEFFMTALNLGAFKMAHVGMHAGNHGRALTEFASRGESWIGRALHQAPVGVLDYTSQLGSAMLLSSYQYSIANLMGVMSDMEIAAMGKTDEAGQILSGPLDYWVDQLGRRGDYQEFVHTMAVTCALFRPRARLPRTVERPEDNIEQLRNEEEAEELEDPPPPPPPPPPPGNEAPPPPPPHNQGPPNSVPPPIRFPEPAPAPLRHEPPPLRWPENRQSESPQGEKIPPPPIRWPRDSELPVNEAPRPPASEKLPQSETSEALPSRPAIRLIDFARRIFEKRSNPNTRRKDGVPSGRMSDVNGRTLELNPILDRTFGEKTLRDHYKEAHLQYNEAIARGDGETAGKIAERLGELDIVLAERLLLQAGETVIYETATGRYSDDYVFNAIRAMEHDFAGSAYDPKPINNDRGVNVAFEVQLKTPATLSVEAPNLSATPTGKPIRIDTVAEMASKKAALRDNETPGGRYTIGDRIIDGDPVLKHQVYYEGLEATLQRHFEIHKGNAKAQKDLHRIFAERLLISNHEIVNFPSREQADAAARAWEVEYFGNTTGSTEHFIIEPVKNADGTDRSYNVRHANPLPAKTSDTAGSTDAAEAGGEPGSAAGGAATGTAEGSGEAPKPTVAKGKPHGNAAPPHGLSAPDRVNLDGAKAKIAEAQKALSAIAPGTQEVRPEVVQPEPVEVVVAAEALSEGPGDLHARALTLANGLKAKNKTEKSIDISGLQNTIATLTDRVVATERMFGDPSQAQARGEAFLREIEIIFERENPLEHEQTFADAVIVAVLRAHGIPAETGVLINPENAPLVENLKNILIAVGIPADRVSTLLSGFTSSENTSNVNTGHVEDELIHPDEPVQRREIVRRRIERAPITSGRIIKMSHKDDPDAISRELDAGNVVDLSWPVSYPKDSFPEGIPTNRETIMQNAASDVYGFFDPVRYEIFEVRIGEVRNTRMIPDVATNVVMRLRPTEKSDLAVQLDAIDSQLLEKILEKILENNMNALDLYALIHEDTSIIPILDKAIAASYQALGHENYSIVDPYREVVENEAIWQGNADRAFEQLKALLEGREVPNYSEPESAVQSEGKGGAEAEAGVRPEGGQGVKLNAEFAHTPIQSEMLNPEMIYSHLQSNFDLQLSNSPQGEVMNFSTHFNISIPENQALDLRQGRLNRIKDEAARVLQSRFAGRSYEITVETVNSISKEGENVTYLGSIKVRVYPEGVKPLTQSDVEEFREPVERLLPRLEPEVATRREIQPLLEDIFLFANPENRGGSITGIAGIFRRLTIYPARLENPKLFAPHIATAVRQAYGLARGQELPQRAAGNLSKLLIDLGCKSEDAAVYTKGEIPAEEGVENERPPLFPRVPIPHPDVPRETPQMPELKIGDKLGEIDLISQTGRTNYIRTELAHEVDARPETGFSFDLIGRYALTEADEILLARGDRHTVEERIRTAVERSVREHYAAIAGDEFIVEVGQQDRLSLFPDVGSTVHNKDFPLTVTVKKKAQSEALEGGGAGHMNYATTPRGELFDSVVTNASRIGIDGSKSITEILSRGDRTRSLDLSFPITVSLKVDPALTNEQLMSSVMPRLSHELFDRMRNSISELKQSYLADREVILDYGLPDQFSSDGDSLKVNAEIRVMIPRKIPESFKASIEAIAHGVQGRSRYELLDQMASILKSQIERPSGPLSFAPRIINGVRGIYKVAEYTALPNGVRQNIDKLIMDMGCSREHLDYYVRGEVPPVSPERRIEIEEVSSTLNAQVDKLLAEVPELASNQEAYKRSIRSWKDDLLADPDLHSPVSENYPAGLAQQTFMDVFYTKIDISPEVRTTLDVFLNGAGLKPIVPNKGEKFSRQLHEATQTVKAVTVPHNHIMGTIRPGFERTDGVVTMKAHVILSDGPPPS